MNMTSVTLEKDCKNISISQQAIYNSDMCNESMDEWTRIKDKNDNLQSESARQLESHSRACRTCFNLIETDSYFSINTFLTPQQNLQSMINMCLPKIDLLLTKDPVLCIVCLTKLEDFYNFSVECIKMESKLASYCSEVTNQVSGPIHIIEFLKDSKDEPDFVTVKQENNLIGEHNNSLVAKEDDDEDMDRLSNDETVEVKSEAENSNSEPCESVEPSAKRNLRKQRKLSVRIRVAKKPFSSDLVEAEVKCETCSQKFTSKWALDRHIPVHKPENNKYSCNSCNMTFKYKHSFDKHMQSYLTGAPPTKPFSCKCGKFFNRMSKLKKHQEIHIKKEKPFSCKECGKRFIEETLLQSHIDRVHTSEKAFSCELCGNKYTSKPGLDVHFKTHFPESNPRPEPDLMCDVCGKLFYRKYSLEKHRMSHTGDKPHECEQCSMKFKERYQLTIHMRRHTGEKPFKCEVCDFKFPSKNRLGVHMRIHTGVRPFPCQLCDMAFARNDHLIKHVRAIHTGERPFECDVCSKTFNRKDYLFKHKRVHSKGSS